MSLISRLFESLPKHAQTISRRKQRQGRRRLRQAQKLESRQLLAGVISEIMPDNQSTLADEDGDFSGWLEIRNDFDQPVDLGNFYLSTDVNNLTQWQFPNPTSLAAGEHLVVFASAKNRANAGSELHTNFVLNSAGGDLVLVQPDGTSIESSIDAYPALGGDQAYGLRRAAAETDMVADGTPADVLIPTATTTDWTGADPFDANSWIQGASPIGYESPNLFADFFVETFLSTVEIASLAAADNAIAGNDLISAFSDTYSTVNMLNTAGAGRSGNDDTFPGLTIGTDANDFAVRATGTILLSEEQAGTWTFATHGDDGGRVRVNGVDVLVDDTLHGNQDRFGSVELPAGAHVVEATFFERGGGASFELYAAEGDFTVWNDQFRLIGSPEGLPTGGFTSRIQTNLEADMFNVNPSAYARFPFNLNDPAEVSTLNLDVGYNDGFVAYLNGEQIGEANSIVSPEFNTTANGAAGFGHASFDLGGSVSNLRSGENILAIQGLNVSDDDADFFIQPHLSGRVLQPESLGLLATPSPGAPVTLAPPQITEFLADNNNTLDDSFGRSSDWIEIHNPNAQDLNLEGYYLTDDPLNLTLWQFPNVNMLADEYLVVFASGDDLTGDELHTNFQLDGDGDYLALVAPDGMTIVSEFLPGGIGFGPQFEDVSFGPNGSATFAPSPNGNPQIGVIDPFTVRQVAASATFPGGTVGQLGGTNNGLGDTDALLALPPGDPGIAQETTVTADLINFLDVDGGGGIGEFANDVPFPLDVAGVDENDFAIHVTATLAVPSGLDGDYVFGVNSDDGSRLRIGGVDVINDNVNHAPLTTTGVATLTAGMHDLDFVFFERGGGAEVELFYTTMDEDGGMRPFELLTVIDPSLLEPPAANTPPVFFPDPTPGGPNNIGYETYVGEVNFSVLHGFFDNQFDLEITHENQNVQIRYTLDGTAPTETSLAYTGPLTIDSTTTIRAAAFLDGANPPPLHSQTYIFLADVYTQQKGVTPPGFPSTWGNNLVDYGLDQGVINHPVWGQELDTAFTQIPSMSIIMDPEDLFSESTGIYSNAANDGRNWERPMSLEMIYPEGYVNPYGDALDLDGFQIDSGVRIRGGFSRSDNNPKHAFRFFFRDEYGDSPKLNYELFGDEGADRFDKIDLRTAQNYSWSFQNSEENTFLRDVFSRDLQGELGQPYKRGRYYHLYINGHYWGLYQTDERAEARYGESYFGGDSDDYDAIKHDPRTVGATDGNTDAYERLWNYFVQPDGLSDVNIEDYYQAQGMNPDGSINPDFERLLDVDNLIDYMIITYYTSDADGPGSRFTRPGINNYFALYNRENPDGFKFFEHDSEHSLDTGDAAGANYNMVTPFVGNGQDFARFNAHWMHEQLATNNSEYLQQFVDRVTELFKDGGILDPTNVADMLNFRASQINSAIIAESARWGDGFGQTVDTWSNAVQTTIDWTADRREVLLQQLRDVGWYPSIGAPVISPDGGAFDAPQLVTVSAPAGQPGQVFYTIDGTDPINPDGTPSATAMATNELLDFVNDQTAGNYFLPNAPVAGWETLAFNDNAWTTASNQVGFDTGQPEGFDGFQVRVVDTSTGDIANLNLATQILNGDTNGFTVASDTIEFHPYVNFGDNGNLTFPAVTPVFGTADREHYAIRATTEVTIPAGTFTIDVGSDDGFSVNLPGVVFDQAYGLNGTVGGIGTDTIAFVAPRGHGHTGGTFTLAQPLTTTLTLDFYERGGGDSVELSIFNGAAGGFDAGTFEILQNGTQGWQLGFIDPGTDFSPFIQTNLPLNNVGTSAYLRYPFEVVDVSNVNSLLMDIRYDDGVSVFLNGTPVYEDLAPNPLAFDSAATERRQDADAVIEQRVNLTDWIGDLQNGTNVLAIQVLNAEIDNPDLLLNVELFGNTNSTPFTLNDTALVTARSLYEGEWSGATEAFFAIGETELAITEINYNPHNPLPQELALDPTLDADDIEYIEVTNLGQTPIDLTNAQVAGGIQFDFNDSTIGSLAPGERLLVVAHLPSFQVRYGNGLDGIIAGEYTGGLSNRSEELQLINGAGETIMAFTYSDRDGWPARADGDGSSLEVIDPQGDYNDALNWRPSLEYLGSPGIDGAGTTTEHVVINEVLTHTDLPAVDAIELYNTTSSPIDISGWWLSDSNNNYGLFQIPANTTIAANGYLVFDENDFNPTPTMPGPLDFALSSSEGEDVFLLSGAIGTDVPLEFRDDQSFGAAFNGETWGLWPDENGRLYPMTANTLGGPNSGPRVGPVVITEFNYNPADPDGPGGIDPLNLEFVEIYNPTGNEVSLENWTLDGANFDFPAGSSIPAGGVLVVVPFDPQDAANAQLLQDFRDHYGIDAGVVLIGGYSGQLDDDGEALQLYHADTPAPDAPNFFPQVLEDEVRYEITGDWPTALGDGNSLSRPDFTSWGNDPANWVAGAPTPGTVAAAGELRLLNAGFNQSLVDPPNLPVGPQPSSWRTQRSDIQTIDLTFSTGVAPTPADFVLTNLGVDAPATDDVVIPLEAQHVQVSGNRVTLTFDSYELPDGVYQLEVLDTLQSVGGENLVGGFLMRGSADNGFYKLAGEWNGDTGATIFDISTLAYWFGQPVGVAPEYADINNDNGVTIFDFPAFAANFGTSVTFPTAKRDLLVAPEHGTQAEQPGREEVIRELVAEQQDFIPLAQLPSRRDDTPQRVQSGQTEADAAWEALLEELAQDMWQN